MALARNDSLLVAADEDYSDSADGISLNAPSSLAGTIESAEGLLTRPLRETGPITADVVYVGRACLNGTPPNGTPGGDPLLANPAGKIALVDRGACLFSQKLNRVQQAGALAAIVVNSEDGPPVPMGGPSDQPSVTLSAVMIGKADGERIKASLSGGTAVNATLSSGVVSAYNDWGYLRFFDVSDPANPRQVGRFGTANTFTDRLKGPPDAGRYSVHNPIVDGDVVFASWYSDGVRAIDISDPANPRELAAFVPPSSPALSSGVSFGGKPSVWGVVKQGDLLYVSDMNYGLWILRYSPQ